MDRRTHPRGWCTLLAVGSSGRVWLSLSAWSTNIPLRINTLQVKSAP